MVDKLPRDIFVQVCPMEMDTIVRRLFSASRRRRLLDAAAVRVGAVRERLSPQDASRALAAAIAY